MDLLQTKRDEYAAQLEQAKASTNFLAGIVRGFDEAMRLLQEPPPPEPPVE